MRTDVVPFVVCSILSVANRRASNKHGNSFSVLNQRAIAVPISSGESPWPLVSVFDSNFRLRWPSAAELAVRRLHYPRLALPWRVYDKIFTHATLIVRTALGWPLHQWQRPRPLPSFDAVPGHTAPSRAPQRRLESAVATA